MKRVLVIWEDAHDLDDGPWVARDGLKPSHAAIFHQIGFLHEHTAEAVVLTGCVGDDFMAPRSRIPAGMVKSIVELTEGEPVTLPKKRRKA